MVKSKDDWKLSFVVDRQPFSPLNVQE